MIALILAILPLALGAAVSPLLFGIEVLALTSGTRAVARAWAVTAGAALVLGLLCAAGLLLGSAPPHRRPHPTTDAIVAFTAAGLLLGLAAWQLATASRATSKPSLDQRLEGASTRSFLVAGVLGMVTNLSTLVLFLPALHEIAKSQAGVAASAVALVVLVGITLLPVVVPSALVTILGDRAEPTLRRMNGFLSRHSRSITLAIEIGFAIVLVAKGIAKLA